MVLMKGSSLNSFTRIVIIIAALGALNWGLIGFFNFNLVDAVFSGSGGARASASGFSRLLYSIIGVAGLATLLLLPKVHADPSHRDLAHRAA